MKKFLITVLLLEIIIFINPNNYINCSSYAVTDNIISNNNNNNNNSTEIINAQKENLNIPDFIKEAEKYTKQSMPDMDLNDLLSTAISGGIDNVRLIRFFWSLLRQRDFKCRCCIKWSYCYYSNTWNFKEYK